MTKRTKSSALRTLDHARLATVIGGATTGTTTTNLENVMVSSFCDDLTPAFKQR